MIANTTVSIIVPMYNNEQFITETIQSVLNQTYNDFEMLIVDDCSNDKSVSIVESFCKKDARIKLIKLENNSGAAFARNKAISVANGRYIAFLDADDLWKKDKLKKQIEFMDAKKCGFSCASYEVIAEDGTDLQKKIKMLPKLDYKGFLTNNLLQTVGIMIDRNIVSDELIKMPDLRRRQDAATWLQILKSGHECTVLKIH